MDLKSAIGLKNYEMYMDAMSIDMVIEILWIFDENELYIQDISCMFHFLKVFISHYIGQVHKIFRRLVVLCMGNMNSICHLSQAFLFHYIDLKCIVFHLRLLLYNLDILRMNNSKNILQKNC